MATIQALGAEVSKLTEALGSQLQAGNHREPGFSPDSLASYPNDSEILKTRAQLLEKARDLVQLASGPQDYIFLEISTFALHDTINLQALSELDFFSKVPIEGGASYAEIATAANLPEEIVRRVLRYSFTYRLFAPDPKDSARVVHTANSAYVARNPLVLSWVGHNLDEVNAAGGGLVKSLKQFSAGTPLGSQEIDESGFAVSRPLRGDGSRTDMWKSFDDEPWRAKRFIEAMQVVIQTRGALLDAVIENYDWKSLGKATVVDVGGSDGHVLLPTAQKYPDLKIVVQDRPRTEPGFKQLMQKNPAVADRFTYLSHSFFDPQPLLPGGEKVDVFFLKHILHDWPEDKAVQILKNLLPALKPTGQIILCDSVIPSLEQAGLLPHDVRKWIAALDVQMLALFNAQERPAETWARIVQKTDPNLKMKKTSPGALVSLIEISW